MTGAERQKLCAFQLCRESKVVLAPFMKQIKSIFICAMTVATVSFLSSAQQSTKVSTQSSPDALVASLYKQHKKQSPFFQTRNRALLDRYFDRKLGDLILKDALRSKNEVGALDGDPLFNAQDMEIKYFSIHKPTFANGSAEVTVSFTNFGKPEQITFLLSPRKAGWRITNIKYDDGTDLLGILRTNSGSEEPGQEIKVFLIAVGDNGAAGKKIGCGDSLVPVTRTIKPTTAPLTAAIRELLSISTQPEGTPKLENFWKGRNLNVRGVSIRNQVATIHISGKLSVAGVCDEPRIQSQIEETARQFPNVKKVRVFIGNRTLADAIR